MAALLLYMLEINYILNQMGQQTNLTSLDGLPIANGCCWCWSMHEWKKRTYQTVTVAPKYENQNLTVNYKSGHFI